MSKKMASGRKPPFCFLISWLFGPPRALPFSSPEALLGDLPRFHLRAQGLLQLAAAALEALDLHLLLTKSTRVGHET